MTPRAAIASRNRRSVHAHSNTHTHIYITKYITHASVCDCDGAKFGARSGAFIHSICNLKWLKIYEEARSMVGFPRFRCSLQSPVGEIAPVFVCQRVAFLCPPLKLDAKSFPPAGIHVDLPLEGIFTGKHQQFESTLSEIGRYNSWSFRGAARENYLIDCTLWY